MSFQSLKRKHLFLFPKASKANRHLNIRGNVAAVQRLEVFSFCIMPEKTESSALLFSAVVCVGKTGSTGRSGHCLQYCLVFYYKLRGYYRLGFFFFRKGHKYCLCYNKRHLEVGSTFMSVGLQKWGNGHGSYELLLWISVKSASAVDPSWQRRLNVRATGWNFEWGACPKAPAAHTSSPTICLVAVTGPVCSFAVCFQIHLLNPGTEKLFAVRLSTNLPHYAN